MGQSGDGLSVRPHLIGGSPSGRKLVSEADAFGQTILDRAFFGQGQTVSTDRFPQRLDLLVERLADLSTDGGRL